jgi:hypothetical protein
MLPGATVAAHATGSIPFLIGDGSRAIHRAAGSAITWRPATRLVCPLDSAIDSSGEISCRALPATLLGLPVLLSLLQLLREDMGEV